MYVQALNVYVNVNVGLWAIVERRPGIFCLLVLPTFPAFRRTKLLDAAATATSAAVAVCLYCARILMAAA